MTKCVVYQWEVITADVKPCTNCDLPYWVHRFAQADGGKLRVKHYDRQRDEWVWQQAVVIARDDAHRLMRTHLAKVNG